MRLCSNDYNLFQEPEEPEIEDEVEESLTIVPWIEAPKSEDLFTVTLVTKAVWMKRLLKSTRRSI